MPLLKHAVQALQTTIFSYPPNFKSSPKNLKPRAFDERDDEFLTGIKNKYSDKFTRLTGKYDNPESQQLGVEIIKLTNECNKEILKYAEQNRIDYIDFQDISTKELKETTAFVDKMFAAIESNNPEFFNENGAVTSFKAVKNIITPEQRKQAHYIIHLHSLACAGVSALMGEACATGADIPLLVTIETGMFARLLDNFDASCSAGMIHAAKHMFSAGMVGGKVLKWLNSVCSVGGHIIAAPTTAGAGNVAITGYLRASNGALSAAFCEYMGWAFVKDYKNGKMNVRDKGKEAISSIVFLHLLKALMVF